MSRSFDEASAASSAAAARCALGPAPRAATSTLPAPSPTPRPSCRCRCIHKLKHMNMLQQQAAIMLANGPSPDADARSAMAFTASGVQVHAAPRRAGRRPRCLGLGSSRLPRCWVELAFPFVLTTVKCVRSASVRSGSCLSFCGCGRSCSDRTGAE